MSLAKSPSVTAQPLPSWQDGPARRAIIEAVDRVTRRASTLFVPPTERIAVFDNDGTLWPEQVIGSTIALHFEIQGSKPVLRRLPKVDAIDDKEGKPVSIQKFIGRRPIMAFGNSDGDLAMLQWTMSGTGARFAALLHHTDADREWAYDRDSHFGRLDRALVEAHERGWTVIDMKSDWKRVYAFERCFHPEEIHHAVSKDAARRYYAGSRHRHGLHESKTAGGAGRRPQVAGRASQFRFAGGTPGGGSGRNRGTVREPECGLRSEHRESGDGGRAGFTVLL